MAEAPTYVLRTTDYQGHRVWVAFDAKISVVGKPRDSKAKVVQRFRVKADRPVTQYTRYQGILRLSEAAMTISSVRKGV